MLNPIKRQNRGVRRAELDNFREFRENFVKNKEDRRVVDESVMSTFSAVLAQLNMQTL